MEFVIKIYDRPEAAALRDVHRKAHLDYLKSFDDATRFAGPFLTDDGKLELGSFRILDLPDRAAAEEHVANEPFIIEGIQERPSVHRWRATVPHSWRDCPRKEGNLQFYVHALDKTGSDIRKALHEEHVAYLTEHGDSVMVRGPLVTDDGEIRNGSVLLLDFPDIEAARAFWAAEPYSRAGLYESVEFYAWRFGRVFDRFKTPA